GLFGEMVIGSIRNLLSIDDLIEERTLSFVLFTASVFLFLFILGFTFFELKVVLKKILIYCSAILRSLSKTLFIIAKSVIFLFAKNKNTEKLQSESENMIFRQDISPLDENLKVKEHEYSTVTKSRPSMINYILPKFCDLN
ncbi:MAG: hypothetical protein ACJZ89_06495, partial [Paracoccaceae bacterium]